MSDNSETAATEAGRKPMSRSALMVAMLMAGALLGKVLGLVREIMMARVFGASIVADSFRGSVTAVLLPINLVQNESVPAIMVPMCRQWQKEGHAPRKLAELSIALTLAATLVMLLVQLSGPWWVRLIVGGFSAEAQQLTLEFVRIMALWMPASVLLNCLAAGEIAIGRSRIASIRAPLLNVAMIVAITLYAATHSLSLLPWCFTAAFNGLAVWSVVILMREGLLDPSSVDPAGVLGTGLAFLRRLRPFLIQPVFEQGQVWLERRIASGLSIGTVASVDYARTLTDSAILLVSQPVGMGVLYNGSTAEGGDAEMEAIARPLLAIAIPASIFLTVFAPDIVWLVFGRGAFDAHAQHLTAGAVRGIAAGLWAAMLGWILIRILNNRGHNVRATLILAASYVVNALVNIVTPHLVGPEHGTLALGLGETARGLILLGGTAIAVGCHRRLLEILAQCLPTAAAMLVTCIAARFVFASSIAHLVWGAAAMLAFSMASAFILIPDQARRVFIRLAKRRSSGPIDR